MTQKRIFIIYTGGTVGMKKTETGYMPVPGFLTERIKNLQAFHHPDLPQFTIHELSPLLDSSNVSHKDWHTILQLIVDNYADYDGFIIIHGTDTMAYTASALSFALQNLAKPVILTGSQVPLVEAHSDAKGNLISAMLLAANYAIPEVCVYFNTQLFRGNRCRKVNTQSVAAFDSPNYPCLAKVGTHIQLLSQHLLTMPDTKLVVNKIDSIPMLFLPLFPGMMMSRVRKLLAPQLRAIILQSYGTGNAPSNDPEFFALLEKAKENKTLVINSSQCLTGTVNMNEYATGRRLLEFDVISGGDMTPEAISTKLQYLLSQHQDIDVIKTLIEKNMRGELTLCSK